MATATPHPTSIQYVEYSANTELSEVATFNPENIIFSVPREGKGSIKFYRVYISVKNESGSVGKMKITLIFF